MSSFFLQLPDNLTCSVLGEWLDVRCLGRLDNVMCSHSQRRVWLDFLSSSKCIFVKLKVSKASPSFLAWIIRRRLAVSNFCLFNVAVPLDVLDHYLQTSDKYVHDLYVNSRNEADHGVLSRCKMFHHLKTLTYSMSCSADSGRLLTILNNNVDLVAIKIYYPHRGCSQTTFNNLSLPNLTTLACRIHKGLTPLFRESLLRLDVDDDSGYKVPDNIVQETALRCTKLRTLRCEAVYLGPFLDNCFHIVNLCLTKCSVFTDDMVLQIVQTLPRLRALDLSDGTPHLTVLAIDHIAEYCGATLQVLHLYFPALSTLSPTLRGKFAKLQTLVLTSFYKDRAWSLVEKGDRITLKAPLTVDAEYFDTLLPLERINVFVMPPNCLWYVTLRLEDAASVMKPMLLKILETYPMIHTIHVRFDVEFLREMFKDYLHLCVCGDYVDYGIDVMALNV